jgi:hypothetical protein
VNILIIIIIIIITVVVIFFFLGAPAPSGPEPPHYRGFAITLRHTIFGDQAVAATTHNTHKKQISMPSARFEAAIPASERPQTNPLDLWDRHYVMTAV